MRSAVVVCLVAAACGGSAGSPSGEGADTPLAPTVGASVTTTPDGTVAEPSPAPDSSAPAPALAGPAGPQPSFNESSGCGSLQGYRGPMVARPGYQADDVVIAGPWGDYFGRTIGEVRSHLVLMTLPTVGDDTDNKVWVHERVAPALQRVIDALLEHQVMGLAYRIEVTSSFRPETVPPHRYLSFHAVGAAIDVNPASNPYRPDDVLVTDLPEWFVQIWRDAGWCWGGDWLDIKDAMHFSWRGPLHTAGYQAHTPIEPRSEPSPYSSSVTFSTHLGAAPPGSVQLVADVDRDGAPDAVRISAWTQTGRLGVEAARARHGYATCWAAGPTARPALRDATLILADRTGDGRPDLWEVGVSAGHVTVVVHAFASGYRTTMEPVVVPGPAHPGAVYLAGDHDRDGAIDLYVVTPGDPVRVEVFAGPGFEPMLTTTVALAASSSWRFALGDHDSDGVPDLFAVSPDDPAVVAVTAGRDGFATAPYHLHTGIGRHTGAVQTTDLDGDGRDDLVFFDRDGTVTAYFGGNRGTTPDADVVSWFFTGADEPWGDGQPWSPGAGCRVGRAMPGRR